MSSKKFYQIGTASVAASALMIRLHDSILIALQRGQTLAQGLLSFFSFFTVLTTILIITCLVSTSYFSSTRLGRFFSRASIQAGLVIYIIIVASIYHILLAHLWCPEGLNLYADSVLHYGLPGAYVMYWVLYTPKGLLHWHHAVTWAGFPAAYSVYILVRGYFTNSYPYHFGNVTELGYARALINAGCIIIGFIVAGLILVCFDRWLAKRGSC